MKLKPNTGSMSARPSCEVCLNDIWPIKELKLPNGKEMYLCSLTPDRLSEVMPGVEFGQMFNADDQADIQLGVGCFRQVAEQMVKIQLEEAADARKFNPSGQLPAYVTNTLRPGGVVNEPLEPLPTPPRK